MILIWSSADDPPADRVTAVLRDRAIDVVSLADMELEELDYELILGPTPEGWIKLRGRTIPLDEVSGIYLRPGEPARGTAMAASMTMLAIASALPAIVVNRPTAGRSNFSKPFQLSLIEGAGFSVPDTLVTTDPDVARAFLRRHGRVVYKSVSGVRSIVSSIEANDADRLDGVRTGPVQLQQWIAGMDVRVHVVGSRWFATVIESTVDDYRYAGTSGGRVAMAAIEIPDALGEKLVALTKSFGLLVSGVDLRRTPQDDWCCFEVNPSPGFTFYEDATGQPIAEAIADLLSSKV